MEPKTAVIAALILVLSSGVCSLAGCSAIDTPAEYNAASPTPDASVSEPGGIIVFRFSTGDEGTENGGVEYEATLSYGVCSAVIRQDGTPPEEAIRLVTDASIMERLLDITEKYRLNEWSAFKQHDGSAPDAASFYLAIDTDNGEHILAYSNAEFPVNYADAAAEITALFNEVYGKGYENAAFVGELEVIDDE